MSERASHSLILFLLSVVVLLPGGGCSRGSSTGAAAHSGSGNSSGEDVDEDHLPTVVFTVWDQQIEVFAEYESAVAGSDVRFIVHVSRWRSGEPRREGPATLLFTHEQGDRLELPFDKPTRDGIYIGPRALPRPGVWKLQVRLPFDSTEWTVDCPPVVVHPDRASALDSATEEDDDGIVYLKEEQWRLSMRTEVAERRDVIRRRRYPGRVREISGARAHVSTPVVGRLRGIGGVRLAGEGRIVTVGETLAFVEPSPASGDLVELDVKLLAARAAVARTEKALETALKRQNRVRRLAGADAKSARDLENIQLELDNAHTARVAALSVEKTYAAARRSLEESKIASNGDRPSSIELRSPISGSIVSVHAAVGELVAPHDEIYEVLDTSVVWVEASLPERDAMVLPTRAPEAYALVPAAGGGVRNVDLEHHHTDVEVDSRRSVGFIYRARNEDQGLRVGMSVEVLVSVGTSFDVVSIPRSALVDEDGELVVFVQRGGESFEKRYVQVGVDAGDRVEVTVGVDPGDRVVTSASWAVRLASKSTTIPAHHH